MRAREGEHPHGDTGQFIVLAAFAVVWTVDSFFLRKSTFLSHYVPLYVRVFLLATCLAVGAYLFQKGHVVVNPEKRTDDLVTTGAFHYVRHPMYLASILAYAGLTVFTLSIISAALLLLVFVFYNYIASYEERWLEAKFGEDYRQYNKKTGKWLPKLHRAC